jgi:LPS export ABC transporter protein LptC
VLEYSELENPPVRVTRNVSYTFTDSGRVANILNAGKVTRYEVGDSSYSLITRGFELIFFNPSGDTDGVLTAINGYVNGDNSIMIARDSVVFVNNLDERLITEELTWSQDSGRVFTDKFVTIRRADGVIYGKGLVSDENFTDYVIREPTGEIYLDENE